MKSRILTMLMVLVLSFSLAIPVAAGDSTSEKVRRDIEVMSNARLFTEGMTVSSVNPDGTITYQYELTDEVTDYITPHYKDNGDVDVDIVEGTCHDVITLKQDGRVFINGKEMGPMTMMDETDKEVIVPKVAFNYVYSLTPFKGTSSSQYNVGPVTHKSPNVLFDKAIRYLTGYAIGFGIATYLFPDRAATAADILGQIGLSMKSRAEALADNSNALSYKVTEYGRAGNDTFIFYRKYAGTYYLRTNYKGDVTRQDLYEKRTTLS